ncbi:MAG: tRNA (guanosine(46)-N7)-methyltransferase TrmB [Bacteroidota bacterium]
MGRKKLIRIISNKERENLFQSTHPDFLDLKGKWNANYFHNNNPIVLELACGKGEYSLEMAQRFPDKNFIGIDLKGDRLATASDKAIELNIQNVAFLRTNILEIESFFNQNEVSEIWITFPDPRARLRDEKRRLTHTRFLKMYQNILKTNSILYLKTDNIDFFNFSIESLKAFGIQSIQSTNNLYHSDLKDVALGIKTRFEQIFTDKGFSINFLNCIFNAS